MNSTPDIAHTDQLTLVLRYVRHDGRIIERFLGYLPMENHTAEHFFETLNGILKDMGIDIMDCREQSYDNARNMSSKFSGLQTRIRQINPLAEWIPCSAHSLI